MRKLVAALAFVPALALAQGYPSKPVRIVLPFGPGGVADITTRTVAPKMSDGLASRWWSRTCRARAASAPRRRWRTPSPTATRCCCSPTATP